MAIYCERCKSYLHPIEMEEQYSGVKYSIYRCPSCLATRKITHHVLGMNEIVDVPHEEAERVVKKGKMWAAAGLVGLLGLYGLACIFSKKEDE